MWPKSIPVRIPAGGIGPFAHASLVNNLRFAGVAILGGVVWSPSAVIPLVIDNSFPLLGRPLSSLLNQVFSCDHVILL